MPFQSRTQTGTGLGSDLQALARQILNKAGRGVDAAFRTLTLDSLLVRGVSTFGTANAKNFRTSLYQGSAGNLYIPAGTLGQGQVTANQTGITTTVDLTGLSALVQVAAGRRILIHGEVHLSSTVAGDQLNLIIAEGATVLQQAQTPEPVAGALVKVTGSVMLTPSTGLHTYKLQAQRAGGTGTLTMTAVATAPAYILVVDIGT